MALTCHSKSEQWSHHHHRTVTCRFTFVFVSTLKREQLLGVVVRITASVSLLALLYGW